MSRDQGSQRVDAVPYQYAGETLDFEYTAVELDGGPKRSIGDTIDLDISDEGTWETGTLTVNVTVPRSTLQRVFPSGPPCDGELVVTGYCPTNHYRFQSVVATDPISPGEHTGTVELEHEMVRGRVELTPELVRTTVLPKQPPGHSGPPFAERASRKLAHGPVGTVDVDEPVDGRSKDLPTIPTSFSDGPFQADDGNTWYLDLTDEAKPKLYVNSDHGFVVPLLEDEGQHGRGRVRQLVVDLYGTQIMTQFVLKAAELYVVHGETKYPWQERMLTEVCDDLFDGKSPAEVETMLEPGQLSETTNQIATRVQRRRAPHESLERVLELSP